MNTELQNHLVVEAKPKMQVERALAIQYLVVSIIPMLHSLVMYLSAVIVEK